MGKIAATRNMEEWWLFVSGLGISSGLTTSAAAVKASTDDGHRLGRGCWLLCWFGDEKLTGKIAAARNMEEWWLFVSGPSIGSGSTTSVAAIKIDDGS
nr:hypothetical protein CFP56_49922 [Quercus suber]